MPQYQLLIVLLCIGAGSLVSVLANKLTFWAGVCAFIVATAIYLGAGFAGIVMLALFFISAVLATHHKKEQKTKLNISEQGNKRNAGQVLANGGVAGLAGFLAYAFPEYNFVLNVIIAASLSSAMADTLSSELGVIYGRNPINIISLRRDKEGKDGVISIEGTLIGIVGSFIIGITFCVFHGFAAKLLFIIVLAGTIGNLADSFMGATLERSGALSNNAVNFLNTLSAALISTVLYLVW